MKNKKHNKKYSNKNYKVVAENYLKSMYGIDSNKPEKYAEGGGAAGNARLTGRFDALPKPTVNVDTVGEKISDFFGNATNPFREFLGIDPYEAKTQFGTDMGAVVDLGSAIGKNIRSAATFGASTKIEDAHAKHTQNRIGQLQGMAGQVQGAADPDEEDEEGIGGGGSFGGGGAQGSWKHGGEVPIYNMGAEAVQQDVATIQNSMQNSFNTITNTISNVAEASNANALTTEGLKNKLLNKEQGIHMDQKEDIYAGNTGNLGGMNRMSGDTKLGNTGMEIGGGDPRMKYAQQAIAENVNFETVGNTAAALKGVTAGIDGLTNLQNDQFDTAIELGENVKSNVNTGVGKVAGMFSGKLGGEVPMYEQGAGVGEESLNSFKRTPHFQNEINRVSGENNGIIPITDKNAQGVADLTKQDGVYDLKGERHASPQNPNAKGIRVLTNAEGQGPQAPVEGPPTELEAEDGEFAITKGGETFIIPRKYRKDYLKLHNRKEQIQKKLNDEQVSLNPILKNTLEQVINNINTQEMSLFNTIKKEKAAKEEKETQELTDMIRRGIPITPNGKYKKGGKVKSLSDYQKGYLSDRYIESYQQGDDVESDPDKELSLEETLNADQAAMQKAFENMSPEQLEAFKKQQRKAAKKEEREIKKEERKLNREWVRKTLKNSRGNSKYKEDLKKIGEYLNMPSRTEKQRRAIQDKINTVSSEEARQIDKDVFGHPDPEKKSQSIDDVYGARPSSKEDFLRNGPFGVGTLSDVEDNVETPDDFSGAPLNINQARYYEPSGVYTEEKTTLEGKSPVEKKPLTQEQLDLDFTKKEDPKKKKFDFNQLMNNLNSNDNIELKDTEGNIMGREALDRLPGALDEILARANQNMGYSKFAQNTTREPLNTLNKAGQNIEQSEQEALANIEQGNRSIQAGNRNANRSMQGLINANRASEMASKKAQGELMSKYAIAKADQENKKATMQYRGNLDRERDDVRYADTREKQKDNMLTQETQNTITEFQARQHAADQANKFKQQQLQAAAANSKTGFAHNPNTGEMWKKPDTGGGIGGTKWPWGKGEDTIVGSNPEPDEVTVSGASTDKKKAKRGGDIEKLANKGRFGDTELAHVNEYEKSLLESMGGSGTTNPETGLDEYWFQFIPMIASAIGGMMGNKDKGNGGGGGGLLGGLMGEYGGEIPRYQDGANAISAPKDQMVKVDRSEVSADTIRESNAREMERFGKSNLNMNSNANLLGHNAETKFGSVLNSALNSPSVDHLSGRNEHRMNEINSLGSTFQGSNEEFLNPQGVSNEDFLNQNFQEGSAVSRGIRDQQVKSQLMRNPNNFQTMRHRPEDLLSNPMLLQDKNSFGNSMHSIPQSQFQQIQARYGGQVPRYSRGGSAKNDTLENVADKGRMGDTELVHVNKFEKELLKSLGGSGTTNPETGLKEYFWNMIAQAAPAIMGAAGGGKGGGGLGGMLGGGVGGGDASAPIGPATAQAAKTAPAPAPAGVSQFGQPGSMPGNALGGLGFGGANLGGQEMLSTGSPKPHPQQSSQGAQQFNPQMLQKMLEQQQGRQGMPGRMPGGMPSPLGGKSGIKNLIKGPAPDVRTGAKDGIKLWNTPNERLLAAVQGRLGEEETVKKGIFTGMFG